LRKLVITALVGAIAALGFGILAGGAAHADPACFPGGHAAGPITVGGAQSGTGGYAQVCIEGSVPITGTVTAFGDASSQQGYVVADGNSTNPGAGAGYIGVSSIDNGLVACASGDYDPTGTTANNQLLPLPTDANFQSDLQRDLAALQAQAPPCGVSAP